MRDGKRKEGRNREYTPEKKQDVRETWKPRTELGRKVSSGEVRSLDEALSLGLPLLESEIVDVLLPNLSSELLNIGQMKGKFGGGKRRAFKQTQRKTQEGNSISFSTLAVVGNLDGFVGIGFGKSRETVPAREKAFRNAKINVIKIRRGSGSWKGADPSRPHSIPFTVRGKCGSTEITLIPAPKGTGLCVEKECQTVLRLAGISDIWSRSRGKTRVKYNLVQACIEALKQTVEMKTFSKDGERLGIVEGSNNTTRSADRVSQEVPEEVSGNGTKVSGEAGN